MFCPRGVLFVYRISHNSKRTNDASTGNSILRKLLVVDTFSAVIWSVICVLIFIARIVYFEIC